MRSNKNTGDLARAATAPFASKTRPALPLRADQSAAGQSYVRPFGLLHSGLFLSEITLQRG